MTLGAFEREYLELLAVGTKGDWKDKLFFEDDENRVEYMCYHMNHNPGTDETHWHIWKFTYSVSGGVSRIEGDLVGSVDGRAGLDWA